uniref:Ubiquitin-like protease family profile domain-containing protein n=1 Tax=Brassica oleracea var. oleracea TaxID=109376 RepID=A0A0D2ZUP8_BRAOL
MLGFQLDIKKKYELWSLVGPEPVRFSLLEFENLTGLNCEYIEDLERPHSVVKKELTSFWEMLGVHVEAGAYTQEIIAALERCEQWSRDDRKRLAVINFVQKDTGEMLPKWEFDVEDPLAENIINLMFVKKPWKWTMDCWEVPGTWVNTKLGGCESSEEKGSEGRHLEPFTYERPTNIPPARAGDCGVYTLKYIECHALGIEFSKKDFARANGKSMRDKMAVDIFQELPDAHEFENKDIDDILGTYDG